MIFGEKNGYHVRVEPPKNAKSGHHAEKVHKNRRFLLFFADMVDSKFFPCYNGYRNHGQVFALHFEEIENYGI